MQKTRPLLLSFLKFTIGWPISIIALFFIAKIVINNGKSVLPTLSNINIPLLLLGIFFFILYYFIRAYIWKKILKLQGYDIPFKRVAYLWELSEFKRFAPGKIWSFIGRASLFGKHNIPQKTIFKSILIEIQFLLLANIIVSILALPFISKYIITFPLSHLMTTAIILLIVLTTMLFIFSGVFFKTSTFRHSGNPAKRGHPESPITIRDAGQALRQAQGSEPSRTARMTQRLSSPKTKISMLITSCLYTLFFGLGTYFTTASIVYLSLELFIQLLGFFVFSFLVSYVSFITPMGLGVREGVTTIGLAKIIPLATSGMVSIFARIVLIFSELCFLGFTYFWKSAKNKYILFWEDFVLRYKQEVVLFLLIIAYIIYFTSASFLRHDNFYTGRFDLGNMDQAVWNTINGRIFETTNPNGMDVISRLAFHADFILILLSPFYLIWDSPKMLLLIQTAVLGIGSFFVYGIGKEIFKEKSLALALATIYLLNPAVQYTNLYDFHPVTLATTFLLAAFYFLIKNRVVFWILFMILAGISKENVWLIIALFGVYAAFVHKKMILGISIFVISLIIFYSLVSHVIPNARGNKHFALSFYSEFGNSPFDIAKNVVFNPQKTFSVITQKNQLTYLRDLFLPVGILPLFAIPVVLPVLPDLLLKLLSNRESLHQIYYQYSAEITPFLFIGAILGINNLKKWFPNIPTSFYICYLLVFAVFSAYTIGPLPGSKRPNVTMFEKPQKNAKTIKAFLATIPQSQSISASNNLGAHLSHREKIYTVPVAVEEADYVLFLLKGSDKDKNKKLVDSIRANNNYVEIFRIEEFIAFKKRN